MKENSHSTIYHNNGVALNGYDVVAYFTEGKAKIGQSIYGATWQELIWQFSSQENLNTFRSNPQEFLPQYGGYCAFGISNDYKALPDLEAFTIHEGKLYLNFADYVKKRWFEKVNEKVSLADQKWTTTMSSVPIKANRTLIYVKYKLLLLFGKDLFN